MSRKIAVLDVIDRRSAIGANALTVIDNVKQRMADIAGSLPKGAEIVPVYDRSHLIEAAIDTLKRTLTEESIIVAMVCAIFLLHLRSALVAILMLPVGILIAFIGMKLIGLGANIMSLGGIAIAVGAMIDAAIVMIENAHKHLERALPDKPRVQILIDAASEVGPALFFSLLIITASFLPIFTLESQEGRLFGPLAFTKTFSMAAAALLSVTLVPVLMVVFVRGKIIPEQKNPINKFLILIYRPIIRSVLKAKTFTIVLALAALAVSVWPARQLGSEFMPNINEGTLLYMPRTLPGISVTRATELLQMQDRIIKSFPEVNSVYGKAGRAATATDPAPSEMFETIINLKPKEQWRPGVTIDGLKAELDKALQFPGVSNAWTMPINGRTDMLATGIRTPVGVKVYGTDLTEIDRLARQIEAVVKTVPGTSSAYAERVIGGYYLDVVPDREALARYGLTVSDVQDVVRPRLAAKPHDHGRRPRALRRQPALSARPAQHPQAIAPTCWWRCPVAAPSRWARSRPSAHARRDHHPNRERPTRDYTSLSTSMDRDLGGYVADAKTAVAASVLFPPGLYPVGGAASMNISNGPGPSSDRRAGHARHHLRAALPEFWAPYRDADRHAVGAVRVDRRRVADGFHAFQHERRRRRRLHRPRRRRRRDRRRDADLSRPCTDRTAPPLCQ